jgi:hypothetical protein
MTKEDRQEYAAFIALLARKADQGISARSVARAADDLCRLSRRHARLAEKTCNVAMGDAEQDAHQRAEDKTEERMNTALSCLNIEGAALKFGGDPRGFTVKLLLPSGEYNTWGGAEEGYGVPQ